MITKGLSVLKSVVPGGDTNMNLGLQMVYCIAAYSTSNSTLIYHFVIILRLCYVCFAILGK